MTFISYPLQVAGKQTRILQSGLIGPPVLMLHGLSSRADRFQRNLDALAQPGRRVFALDLPGHGFAAKGRDFDYTAGGYARWLDALLDELGIERASIVSTSFGGLVASRYAIDRPERVDNLILMGAIGIVPIGMERRQRTINWLPDMTRDSIGQRLRAGIVDKALVTDDWIEEDFRINNSPGAAEAFAALADYYATTIDDDATAPALAALHGRVPVHLIWGTEDASVSPEYGQRAAEIVPGAELRLIEGAGHLPYYEKPNEMNALLNELLSL